jgi:hypothetical protein
MDKGGKLGEVPGSGSNVTGGSKRLAMRRCEDLLDAHTGSRLCLIVCIPNQATTQAEPYRLTRPSETAYLVSSAVE